MRTSALLTAEDFATVAPILGPCELVKGEIVRMSPGGLRHSRVTGNAFALLHAYGQSTRAGRAFTGKTGLVVTRRPDSVRGADVAFVSYRRLPDETLGDSFLTVPPELIVEVLAKDTSWAKIEEKVSEYHAFGVDLVWVADPQTLTVRVYARGAGAEVFQVHDTLSADPVLPGLRVAVHDLFAQ